MEFAAILSTVSGALAIVKEIKDIDKSLSQAELKARMADIYSTLADVKIALADAREEMREKDQEIRDLLNKLESKKQLVEFEGLSYEAGTDGKPIGSPFCSACLAKDGTAIRPAHVLAQKYVCPMCNAVTHRPHIFAWPAGF